MRSFGPTWLILSLLLLAFTSLAAAQEERVRAGRLPREVRDALVPGLKVEYRSLADDNKVDVGTARLAALFVKQDAPPTPFLPPGRFKATFSGYLKLPLRGECAFQFKGMGTAKLKINGEEILAAGPGNLAATSAVKAALAKGFNELEIDYESPAQGDAQFRLFWSGEEFPEETISPIELSHDGRDERWQAGISLRNGREIFATHSCTSCHALDDATAAKLAMPEMAHEAPKLTGVGSRLDENWLTQWILSPQSLRNKTTMPEVLAHLDSKTADEQARDIAAFLASQTDAKNISPLKVDDKLVREGEALFEDRGCISCHRPTPLVDEDDTYDRLSLHFVGAKFKSGALANFLSDTHRNYPWTRMPKFSFSPREAAALEAFLRSTASGNLPPREVGGEASAERGRKLFQEVGCANCHELKPTGSTEKLTSIMPPAVEISKLNPSKGCLAPEVSGKAPRFNFSLEEMQAVETFVKSDLESLTKETPAEFSQRQFATIGCNACHLRDTIEAKLPYILVEESQLGHPPEAIPPLTWAGEKLRTDWMERQFSGELDYRPRPHFHTRMPSFPERAKLLAQGFSAEHGLAPSEDIRPEHQESLVKTGIAVAAMEGGLACHRCHAIGDVQATAPFEARSTNLSYATERLRHEFYHRWMRDPPRIDAETKMIKFALDGKKTGLATIEDGDAQKQFEAVWHYLEVLNRDQKKTGRPAKEPTESAE